MKSPLADEIEAALKVAYENREQTGCGCCTDDRAEAARCEALTALNTLLPPVLRYLRGGNE